MSNDRRGARWSKVALAAALALAAPVARADDTRAQLEAQAATGRIDLATVPAFSRTALAALSLDAPKITSDGSVHAAVRFAGRGVSGCLLPVAPEAHSLKGSWVLALRPGPATLGSLIPGLSGTVADAFDLPRTLIVVALDDVAVDVAAMRTGPDRAFFHEAIGDAAIVLKKGLNIVAAAKPRQGSDLGAALQRLGLAEVPLILQGVVLKDLKLKDLREAQKNGRLAEQLKEDAELRAYLPGFALPGLPKNFATGRASIYVNGSPGVGVGFGLTLREENGSMRDFSCDLGVEKTETGAIELQIVGAMKGRWDKAFGVPGLGLDEARLLLSIDNQQQLGFGLRGELRLGEKSVLIAGKLKLHALTGAPTGGMFEGGISELGSADLLALCDAVGADKGQKASKDRSAGLPEFSLKDAYLRVAPFGGDAALGIESGYAIAGTLDAMGRQLATVDGILQLDGLLPAFQLKAQVADIDLDVVKLRGVLIDILLGLTPEAHFRMRGSTKLLAMEKAVDIDVSRHRLYFDVTDRIAGVYTTRLIAQSKNEGRGRLAWSVRAELQNEFSRTLEQRVSKAAEDWARRTERSFAKAERDLTVAQTKVAGLDTQIDAAKREVQRDRDAHIANVRRAQAEVLRLDGAIAARRKELEGNRAAAQKTVNDLRKAKDAAHSNWQRKKKAREDEKNPFKIAAKKAAEVAAWTAYQSVLGTYKAASKTLAGIVVEGDPKLVSLKTARNTAYGSLKAFEGASAAVHKTPVELDPRVNRLIIARGSALVGLEVAKRAVHVTGKAATGAAKITAWLAKHHGDLVSLDDAAMAGQLATYLSGNKLSLTMNVKFMKKPHRIALSASPADLKGRVFTQVWEQLKATLS